jgi:hypothetical protein
VLDAISGDFVKATYRRLHAAAAVGHRRIAFAFRCDTPDVERRMKMALGPLRGGGKIVGVVYQATILSERTRPPLRFLEPETAIEQYFADGAPVLTCCSFCARVEWPHGAAIEWIAPEVYYQRGGQSDVRISHGACSRCVDILSKLAS